jgi:hypothetical protein
MRSREQRLGAALKLRRRTLPAWGKRAWRSRERECSFGCSAEACHELWELRVKAPVERIGARHLRISGLKAEHKFVKRDEICSSNAKQPGGEQFVSKGPRSEWQLRRCGCSRHLADARLLRRSTIETRDPVTKSSLRRGRLMRSWPLWIASVAAVSISRHMRTSTPSLRLRIR